MKKEKNNKNKVIPEICSREYTPYVKTKRLISPTETIGDDGVCTTEVPDYSTRGRRKIKAFTLIELLVVVLIIGILAAVALPQYEVAVGRAKVAKVLPVLASLRNAKKNVFFGKWHAYRRYGRFRCTAFIHPKR